MSENWRRRAAAIDSVRVCVCVCVRVYCQCDFEVRVLRDLNQQALKLVADAVYQHREIAPAAHLYFSQVTDDHFIALLVSHR